MEDEVGEVNAHHVKLKQFEIANLWHNIIQTLSSVLWDWQYYEEYSYILAKYVEYSA